MVAIVGMLGVFVVCYAGLVVIACSLIRPPGSRLAFAGRSALALAPALVIAYVIMIGAWPWAGLAPLNPLRAIAAFDNFQYPIDTILAGHVYRMADVPRWYVPAYVGIKLSLPLIVSAFLRDQGGAQKTSDRTKAGMASRLNRGVGRRTLFMREDGRHVERE